MINLAESDRQAATDREHLRLLAIFHYIVGALIILFASIFILYVVLGIVLAVNPEALRDANEPPQQFSTLIGFIFAAFGAMFVLAGWTLGGATIYSGRCLRRQKHWLFSVVVAGINCAWYPFGTMLGIFTIVVLLRDSVKKLYGQ